MHTFGIPIVFTLKLNPFITVGVKINCRYIKTMGCMGLVLMYLMLDIRIICVFLKEYQAVNVFNSVILAKNRQLPDDDRMIETCRSIFKKVFKKF